MIHKATRSLVSSPLCPPLSPPCLIWCTWISPSTSCPLSHPACSASLCCPPCSSVITDYQLCLLILASCPPLPTSLSWGTSWFLSPPVWVIWKHYTHWMFHIISSSICLMKLVLWRSLLSWNCPTTSWNSYQRPWVRMWVCRGKAVTAGCWSSVTEVTVKNVWTSLLCCSGSLLALRELVIYSNDLRLIPHCLNKLPLLKIDARDNPLGQPPTPPPLPSTPGEQSKKKRTSNWFSAQIIFDVWPLKSVCVVSFTSLFSHQIILSQKFQSCTLALISTGIMSVLTMTYIQLRFNRILMFLLLLSFCVSSAGCHVFLPGGAELLFPPGCLLKTTRLEWFEKRPERKWVWLEEHDILLSRPLELLPHGVTFMKVYKPHQINFSKSNGCEGGVYGASSAFHTGWFDHKSVNLNSGYLPIPGINPPRVCSFLNLSSAYLAGIIFILGNLRSEIAVHLKTDLLPCLAAWMWIMTKTKNWKTERKKVDQCCSSQYLICLIRSVSRQILIWCIGLV